MSLFSFGFAPVFLSVMGFLIILRSKILPYRAIFRFFLLSSISFFVCFFYPLTKVYITKSYTIFDGFFFYCLIISIVSMVINTVIFLINGVVTNERD